MKKSVFFINIFVRDMTKDSSPLSSRAVKFYFYHPFGLMAIGDKYPIKRFTTRIGGAGFRQISRAYSTRSKKWDRLYTMYTKPKSGRSLPFEWWLGRGFPLNPYLRGELDKKFLSEMAPKEVSLAPSEQFPSDGLQSFFLGVVYSPLPLPCFRSRAMECFPFSCYSRLPVSYRFKKASPKVLLPVRSLH